jgi:hypothetical protein
VGELHRSAATLRIMGDSLDPDEVTRLLGATPTSTRIKGKPWKKAGGREHIARKGSWQLDAEDREPADINDQVRELLEKLTDDLEVWSSLTHRFQVELFCGWFMHGGDEGIGVSPSTMTALSQRGIELGICIYGPPSQT